MVQQSCSKNWVCCRLPYRNKSTTPPETTPPETSRQFAGFFPSSPRRNYGAVNNSNTGINEVGKGLTKDAKAGKIALQHWLEGVGKGLTKDAKAGKLALQHWLEGIDPRHRYGHSLYFYCKEWCNGDADQPFFYWLDKTKFYVIGDGLFTGVTVALYPVSVVKTRLQVATKDSVEKNAFSVIRGLLRSEGVPGLYRGFGTAITGAIPARVIFMTSLETTKVAAFKMIEPFNFSEPTQAAIANGLAGMTSSLMKKVCWFIYLKVHKYTESAVDNRVLKANVETVRAKVKMAEETVKRMTGLSNPFVQAMPDFSNMGMPYVSSPTLTESSADFSAPPHGRRLHNGLVDSSPVLPGENMQTNKMGPTGGPVQWDAGWGGGPTNP